MSNYKQGALASLIISIIIFIIVFILIIAVSYNWRVNNNSNNGNNNNSNNNSNNSNNNSNQLINPQLLAAAAMYNKNHFSTMNTENETQVEMQHSGDQGLYGYVNTI